MTVLHEEVELSLGGRGRGEGGREGGREGEREGGRERGREGGGRGRDSIDFNHSMRCLDQGTER